MATQAGLLYGEITEPLIGVFYDVYNELEHGFLESVYQQAMLIALRERGFRVEQEVPIQVRFRGHRKKIRENPCKSVADGVEI